MSTLCSQFDDFYLYDVLTNLNHKVLQKPQAGYRHGYIISQFL